jgi:hypothetical protein
VEPTMVTRQGKTDHDRQDATADMRQSPER